MACQAKQWEFCFPELLQKFTNGEGLSQKELDSLDDWLTIYSPYYREEFHDYVWKCDKCGGESGSTGKVTHRHDCPTSPLERLGFK